MGRVVSINLSAKKGVKKTPVLQANLIVNIGIEGDAHAASDRQVSLLSIEDILKAKLKPGDFAENITTEGIDLSKIKVGTKLKIGEAVLEVSQLGKECHTHCAIYKKIGNCIMPKQGVFAKVITSGIIYAGDEVTIL